MIYTESAIPPKICVSNTAVAIYLATSINHFPISFFIVAKISTNFETAKHFCDFLIDLRFFYYLCRYKFNRNYRALYQKSKQ